MKKITLLVAFLFSAISFSQSPIITMISDGDCSGGNPKVVEIYADGTVDFSNYSLEIQTNANTTWGNTLNLGGLGVITDDFVYIHKDDASFATEYPSATNVLATTSSAVNFNGDDRIRIIEDASSNVIDQYGAEATDGSGEAWEYKDGYAKRSNGTGPDAGFFAGNWTFFNEALDGEGTCQGGTAFETIIGLGTFTSSGGSNNPVVAISSPADTSILAPGTSSVDIEFAGQNLPNDATFSVTVNGNTTTNATSPFTINTTNGTTYNVTVDAVSGGGSVANDQISFSVGDATQVADIAALRAGAEDGTFYQVTGEAVITYQQGFRNQKYVQDASGAILIDDTAGNISTSYNVGDGLTGLVGTLSSFNGMLQFVPAGDPGAATSTGNTVTPQILTISEFNTNFENYEAELVAFEDVTFTTADGVITFDNGDSYPIEDAGQNTTLVEALFNLEYTGDIVPTNAVNVVGLAGEENNGEYRIYPRDNDIDVTLSNTSFTNSDVVMYPNPVKGNLVSISINNADTFTVEVYNVLGKQVLKQTANKSTQLNTAELNSGVYLVKITEGNQSLTKKLIVQ
ncbi:Por secretion system C-terminal sorting domain-containing protein [Psychroflexus salarius]|uniref:Por secretion system C-terminal sorting domain-containing protein n=1 Tax=Psychroflexus salarius TaxID=1155689 RepID=A0A1M4WK36_9FLAO|nr:T9SS type A sorting domain-containing protein [Psychroflexus salarius]SHE81566.1 Por secretion system C-terminal sorting domain-containing protein [Psychroflexus salarius]